MKRNSGLMMTGMAILAMSANGAWATQEHLQAVNYDGPGAMAREAGLEARSGQYDSIRTSQGSSPAALDAAESPQSVSPNPESEVVQPISDQQPGWGN